jgi:lysine-N-methylase
MILRTPDFYDEFRCIAGECKDSCCIGWELDIDDETFGLYKNAKGEFGERLRAHMQEGDESTDECNTFVLNGKRCPFLNDKNLCDIYINLGEKSLCEVCTEYPRFAVEYDNVLEKSMALSCEEVGRLLFERTTPVRIVEREIDKNPEYEDVETFYTDELRKARDRELFILSDRTKTMHERLEEYLGYADHIQNLINMEAGRPGGLKKGVDGRFSKKIIKEPSLRESRDNFELRMSILSGLEVLDSEWSDTCKELNLHFSNSPTYTEDMKKFLSEPSITEELAIWWEALYNYFTFRYMIKSVYDCEFSMRAKFARLSCDTIRDMALMRWLDTGKFELADMIDVARIYSKEVEHSEDNLDYLADELLFG